MTITLHGLLGDSGMASPRYYLGLTGPSRERLVASPAAYQSAFRSREVLRAVRRPTISTGPFVMTGFFGFDNRLLLPPFFPVQPNSDGIFGLVLQKCMEGSHIAFLPSVLLHEPAAERMFESGQIWTDAGSVRMADIVIACVFASGAGGEHLADATRLVQLGKHLRSVGSLKLVDFEAYVRRQQQYRTMAFITALQSHLQTYGALPRIWADDVKRMIRYCRQRRSRRTMWFPSICATGAISKRPADSARNWWPNSASSSRRGLRSSLRLDAFARTDVD